MRLSILSAPVRIAAAAVVGLALASAPVNAQGRPEGGGRGQGQSGQGGGGPGGGMGGRMFGGMGGDFFGSPVSTRDLETFSKSLGLTAEQNDAAKALLEAANAEFQPVAKAARDKMEAAREEFRESRDPSAFQSMGPQMQEMRTARKKVEETFLTDLKSLLTEEQQQKWPAAERAHRRTKTIGRGLMSGERVDLFRLLERAEVSADTQAQLKELLDQYEVELDRELVKRNEQYDKFESQMSTLGPAMFQAMQGGGGDMAQVEEMIKKGREASTRVRDVNRKYARQIEGVLPEGVREKFQQEFKRESFPMVYRPSYASRVIDAAEKFDDLNESQKTGLAALRESFTRESGTINTKSEAAIEEMENNFSPQNMFARFNDPKMQELRDSRRELEDATIEKVKGLLNDSQKAKLPERERGPGGFGGGDGQQRMRRGGDAQGGEDAAPRNGRRARGGQGSSGQGGGQQEQAPPPPRRD